jgi:HK97 family phage major capsid protein/HK97 family phage prohead protease
VLSRAYSLLEIKSVDDDQRVIVGMATTPEPDRMGDVVEPKGAQFKLPIPLLWQHNSSQPIGHVFSAKVTPDGIEVQARILRIDEAGPLKNRLDEAWQSIKHGLVRGLSIGFKSVEHADISGTYGIRFIKWLWLELSAVTIPANAEATIQAVKSFSVADQDRAALGEGQRSVVSHVSRVPAQSLKSRDPMAKQSLADRIQQFENTRAALVSARDQIMDAATEKGVTMDAEQAEQYDAKVEEIKSVDGDLKRLRDRLAEEAAAATEVKATNVAAAVASRTGVPHSIQVRQDLPPGIGFARYAIAGIMARKTGTTVTEFAKQRWPDHGALHTFIQKANVPAGLTTDSTWAGNLVDQTNLASEFLEYLRPQTVVGRIPNLRRVPFNVRITGQTTGAVANWVGQGKAKPVTSFGTSATTLLWTKIAAIAVITEELARFSSPSAETLVRDELARAVVERMDVDFLDPAQSAVANVSPASITNGLTALTSAGTSEANIRTDITTLLAQFMENNVDVSGLVLVMPNTLAMAASLMVNSLGQPSFPGIGMNGGTLLGIPVVASQYAGNQSGYGNLVVALNARDIALADDGQVSLDSSREASIEMSDAPSGASGTSTGASLVSMYQTNSIAIRAERFINWAKLRTNAVVYMDDVNWGSVGSPS